MEKKLLYEWVLVQMYMKPKSIYFLIVNLVKKYKYISQQFIKMDGVIACSIMKNPYHYKFLYTLIDKYYYMNLLDLVVT